jgi:uncharacterized phage infection (PIP) family protein YhgE
METLHKLLAQREAKAAIAIWALIPTLFLFFALTLAVDPSTQLGKVRLGVAALDEGVQTPQGTMSIGKQLATNLHTQVPVQIVQFASEAEMRDAVLGRDISGGIVLPENMTRDIQSGQTVKLQVIKSDGNDQFTNTFLQNLSSQLSTNLNNALPMLLGGQPVKSLVSVATVSAAVSNDFRFGIIPGTLVLPIWIGTVAFAVLFSKAAGQVRRTPGTNTVQSGIIELGVSAVGAGIVAAVITLDIALFTWRFDMDFLGLFGLLWLGLLASAWIIQGLIRLFGLELGAILAVLALFVQQSVSGAAFPAAFAPDVVRWIEPVAPLRYIVEGLRNVLIGGSTTPDLALALVALAGAGLLIYAGGAALHSFIPSRHSPTQPVATA